MSFSKHITHGITRVLRIPMRGYERWAPAIPPRPSPLRIPMRGYEDHRGQVFTEYGIVTNPHAGL